jgi:two-component system, probable response regulator PhcQ
VKHNVLLVDDEPNLLEGLQRSLCREPFNILTANSGNEALEVLKSASIDAIVADQSMPGMKGSDLLKKVHEIYPDIISYMLTGQATLDVAISAINDGAISRFFTKPCNPADLAFTIRQGLQHRDLMMQAKRLLNEVKRQDVIIDRLEQETPGITEVETDDLGVILLDESSPGDYETLLEELNNRLGEKS